METKAGLPVLGWRGTLGLRAQHHPSRSRETENPNPSPQSHSTATGAWAGRGGETVAHTASRTSGNITRTNCSSRQPWVPLTAGHTPNTGHPTHRNDRHCTASSQAAHPRTMAPSHRLSRPGAGKDLPLSSPALCHGTASALLNPGAGLQGLHPRNVSWQGDTSLG
jgi:hypothetical protein